MRNFSALCALPATMPPWFLGAVSEDASSHDPSRSGVARGYRFHFCQNGFSISLSASIRVIPMSARSRSLRLLSSYREPKRCHHSANNQFTPARQAVGSGSCLAHTLRSWLAPKKSRQCHLYFLDCTLSGCADVIWSTFLQGCSFSPCKSGRRAAADLMTKDEARMIAAGIDKLSGLLKRPQ